MQYVVSLKNLATTIVYFPRLAINQARKSNSLMNRVCVIELPDGHSSLHLNSRRKNKIRFFCDARLINVS